MSLMFYLTVTSKHKSTLETHNRVTVSCIWFTKNLHRYCRKDDSPVRELLGPRYLKNPVPLG